MKCSKAKKIIYLFQELEDRERQKVHAHITMCRACQELYQKVQMDQQLAKKAFLTPISSSEDQVMLTNRIMKEIRRMPDQQISVMDGFFEFITYRPMRYALGMISLFLVAFFLLETNQSLDKGRMLSERVMNFPASVELNSASFNKELKQKFETETPGISARNLSLYDCLKACRSNQDHNCSVCKNKYPKFKQYENI